MHVLLFHHVCGRTAGMQALADRFRDAGHTVALPDLLDGATFETVEEGVAHVEGIGFDTEATELVVARMLSMLDAIASRFVGRGLGGRGMRVVARLSWFVRDSFCGHLEASPPSHSGACGGRAPGAALRGPPRP